MDPMDLKAKEKQIELVLSEQPRVNLWKLRELALMEGGLVNDTLRRRAWPKLVGLSNEVDLVAELDGTPKAATLDKRGSPTADHELRRVRRRVEQQRQHLLIPEYKENEFQPAGGPRAPADDDAASTSSAQATGGKKKSAPSLDSDQIARDVARCTWHLLSGTQRMRRMQMNNKHRRRVATLLRQKQQRLGNLINMTLNHDDHNDDEQAPNKLRYYQGYHDVASICMSTLSASQAESATGLGLSSAVLSRVSTSHFRDAMQDNFIQLQTAIRLTLMPLISYFDPEVHDFLLQVDMEPFFALSWIITWFSHDIRDTDLVKRLFDAFIVSHPLLPLYVTVAMVCHANNRHEILNTEPDFCAVHSVLSNLPKNSSMVGWRYRPTGEGYVSGEEDAPAEDGESSADVFVDHTPGRSDTTKKGACLERSDDEGSAEGSMVSSAVSGEEAFVESFVKAPFQEIIDMALDFMRSVPPRKILNLSKQYYADETLQPMLQLAPDSLLLQPYLEGLKSYADKYLTVIACDEKDGMVARRKRKRRRIIAVAVLAVILASFSNTSCSDVPSTDSNDDADTFSSRSSNTMRGFAVQLVLVLPVLIASEMLEQIGCNPMILIGTLFVCLLMLQMAPSVLQPPHLPADKDEEELTKYYLKSKTNTLAVIACGYGPGDGMAARRKRRKRRRIFAVAVLSVIVASYYVSSSNKSHGNAPSSLPTSFVQPHSNVDTRSSTSIRTTRRSNQCCKWHPTPVYCKPMRREECNQAFMTSGS